MSKSTATFLKLTDSYGDPIYVKESAIIGMNRTKNGFTIISTDARGAAYYVRETIDDVLTMLNAGVR